MEDGLKMTTDCITQFKCQSCGNNLEFNADLNKLKCPYCGSEEGIEEKFVEENNLVLEKLVDEVLTDEIEVYRCENCGSTSEKSVDDIAFTCPYCQKTNVVLLKDIKGIKPTGVVPFKVSKDKAENVFNEWIRKKLYAPRKLKKTNIYSKTSGLYAPCWTFDAVTFSTYEGRIGKRYTTTVGSGKNRRTVTRIRYRNISGTYEMNFDDLKVNASTDLTEKQFSEVQNFDTNRAKAYDKKYLAGFSAVHYDTDLKDAFLKAKTLMRGKIESGILSNYHYDIVDYMNINTAHSSLKYKYILLPFWLLSFGFKKKKYGVVINGVTSKIWGKYPLSPTKITLSIAIPIILGLAVYAMYYFGIF